MGSEKDENKNVGRRQLMKSFGPYSKVPILSKPLGLYLWN